MNQKSNRNVKLLYWFNFFNDFRPYSAVAIIYFAQVTGSYTLALSVFSISHLASAIFEVPTGVLSDRVGRKLTIIFGSVASVFSLVFFAIGGSLSMLMIGAIFEGLAQSLFSGNNDAFLFDTLKEDGKEETFPHWVGRTSSMFQIALGISALIGGFVASWSLSFVMWISVVPQILMLVTALFFREPKVHSDKEKTNIFVHLKEALKRFKEDSQLRNLSLYSIIDYGIGEAQHQFLPAFYGSLWPLWAVGIAKMLSNAFAAVSFWFSGTLIKKFNSFRILIVSHFFNRVISIVAAAFPTPASPALITVTSLSFGSARVARGNLMQQRFSEHQRATMGSLNAFAGSIFFAIFAYILGTFADHTTPALAILFCQLLLLPNIILVWRAYKTS